MSRARVLARPADAILRDDELISFIRLLYAAEPKKRIFLVEVVACYAFLFTFAAVIAIIKI